jgi:CheY-like chemotaxis protein
VKVADLFDELEMQLVDVARERSIRLEFAELTPGIDVIADKVKVAQCIINLVSNAIKFTDADGTVRVTSENVMEGDIPMVKFSVIDSGAGIPAEALGLIFERFRQVDGSHTRRHGGTGLGLAITKKIVELHGGTIGVSSIVGQGSTFSFQIPRMGHSVPAVVAAKMPYGTRVTVAVVEDDQLQLELIERHLMAVGYEVRIIDDNTEAWRSLVENPPDVVILDVMMPRVSGLTILRQLREHEKTRNIPIIVSTAFHANEPVVRRMGAHWLPKPWTKEALVDMVTECARHLSRSQSPDSEKASAEQPSA